MDFRRIISSTKSYKIASVIAVAFLLLLSSVSYRQIHNMKKTADLVSTSLIMDNEINNLFYNFSLIESAGYKSLILKDSSFIETYKNFKNKTDESIHTLSDLTKNVAELQPYIDSINHWTDSLNIVITKLNGYRVAEFEQKDKKIMFAVERMSFVIKKLERIKVGMSQTKVKLFESRKVAYQNETIFTPIISLLLVLFSLAVFIIVFLKINNDHKKLKETQTFVEYIIGHSGHLITYLEPITENDGNISDFRIRYVSNQIEAYTGQKETEIKGEKLSKIFPSVFTNGSFEMFVECVETGESANYERLQNFHSKEKWFNSTVSKLDEGIIITTSDITAEREKTESLKMLNENLFINNVLLENAEVIAKIGSFILYPEDGKAEMSDNLYRLLGCQPGDFEPNIKNYNAFVHPNDLKKVDKVITVNIDSAKITDIDYRIITKDGKIRHFKSNSLMVLEKGNKKILGVIQDITQVRKKDKKLERKNKELARSNAELKSFNRVVSHDLQEPLRKIQMFISLLSESEYENLSEKSIAYFDKINNAAMRMQMLIRNLLSYSRIDVNQDNFEEIDLNKKLEKVKDNLLLSIQESKIKITIVDLPTIKGIPFQMEQLFNNLVSNSIKYRSRTMPPEVLIKASEVSRSQITANFVKKYNRYHKIIISDNGIGFEQENAEKIFEIFERLHQKTEYSGTGIGLAICKKIVENHQGYIHATSELGKGTVFYIYLPV